MPDKKSKKEKQGDDAGEEDGGGGKKSPIVPVLLCIITLALGYIVGGMMSGDAAAETTAAGDGTTAEEAEAEEEHHELGSLVSLDAINVNLQGGHFLRIAVTLEYHAEDSGGGHGSSDAEELATAPAAHLILAKFSGMTVEELSTSEGRDHAREELLLAVEEKYDGQVYGLYFTEFVMQ